MILHGMGMKVSEEERNDVIERMFGKRFDGSVDFDDFDESEMIIASKREEAKEEILRYMVCRIKEEYGLSDDGEALLKWDEYKLKYNLCAVGGSNEQVVPEDRVLSEI
jgi:hypothetical protein